MSIRRAKESDARAVAKLWTEAYVTLGVGGRLDPYTATDFFDSAQRGEIFLSDGESGVLGVVVLYSPGTPGRIVAQPDEAELSRLAVDSAARGMGIGRALADFCEQRARAASWGAIALWSRPLQVEAHRLYESLGYRRLPERDSSTRPATAALFFASPSERHARAA